MRIMRRKISTPAQVRMGTASYEKSAPTPMRWMSKVFAMPAVATLGWSVLERPGRSQQGLQEGRAEQGHD